MADNYTLLTRLLVGVLKHQIKRYLGEDVLATLADAGSEHCGERLLDILKGESATREQSRRLATALQSAAEELDLQQEGGVYLRLEDAPAEVVEGVVEALANLESGDLLGRRLQSAIQDLIAVMVRTDANSSLRISMQLYQAVLMTVLTIPELQPRAQDLLNQSRMWFLSEQIRKIEKLARHSEETALPVTIVDTLASMTHEEAIKEQPSSQSRDTETTQEDDGLVAGHVVAGGTVELVRLLGRGGQATMWQGRLVATDDRVAVRFLNKSLNEEPAIVRSFEREVDTIRALSGAPVPHVVQSVMIENGLHFYVIDYIEETVSLAQVLHSGEAPIATKLEVLCEVAGALHIIHEQGWVHGDVKPENILLERPENIVRFIDFGSARRIGALDVDEPITFTYAYAPPEVLALPHTAGKDSQQSRMAVRSQIEVRVSLDIYPLGVMLFQALDPGLGRIARMEEYGLVGRLLTTPDLKAVVRRALAREPGDRFKSALDFKASLEEAVRAAVDHSNV